MVQEHREAAYESHSDFRGYWRGIIGMIVGAIIKKGKGAIIGGVAGAIIGGIGFFLFWKGAVSGY
ncbi:hypothetical protein KAX17_04555 [Candidatus Bipolaricaulota bacterium]|nr:hypothetical protein [Candidatus Bipolaricaulota bacterium]